MFQETSPPQPEPQESIASPESRFGNVHELIKALESDPAQIKGPIETFYPETPAHQNVVEIADVASRHANRILGVKIQHGDQEIRCIFKPEDGELASEKKKYGLDSLAKREVAAWIVSDHFGFDIVPPTVYREIDGKKGALQLFMDPVFYKARGQGIDPKDLNRQMAGKDFATMAALDAIILNIDRKTDNWLYALDDPTKVIAIDHGVAFHEGLLEDYELQGPLLRFTAERLVRHGKPMEIPKMQPVPISADLIEKLSEGLQPKVEQTLRDRLREYLPTQDIDACLKWAHALLAKKFYLSSINYEQIMGQPYLKAA